MTAVLVEVPIPLPSVANLRQHWAAKARLVKRQRHATALALKVVHASEQRPALPVTVTLTRVSPRKLDDDNLASAFKACRDQVADWLGVDDGDERIAWRYTQAKGKPTVWIRFESGRQTHDVAPGRTNGGRGIPTPPPSRPEPPDDGQRGFRPFPLATVKGKSKLAPNLVRSRKERA